MKENPDNVNSYMPGLFWENSYYKEEFFQNKKLMLVPMDSRSYVSFTGVSDYTLFFIFWKILNSS